MNREKLDWLECLLEHARTDGFAQVSTSDLEALIELARVHVRAADQPAATAPHQTGVCPNCGYGPVIALPPPDQPAATEPIPGQVGRRPRIGGKGGQTLGLEPHWRGCQCERCQPAALNTEHPYCRRCQARPQTPHAQGCQWRDAVPQDAPQLEPGRVRVSCDVCGHKHTCVVPCSECGGSGEGQDRIDGPGDVYQGKCLRCDGTGLEPTTKEVVK